MKASALKIFISEITITYFIKKIFPDFSSFYICADGRHEWSLKHRDYLKTGLFKISRRSMALEKP